MIPELQVLRDILLPAKRLIIRDLTAERLDSLREAVIDFCKRSRSLCEPMHTWSFISKVLRGLDNAEIWWSYEGNHVNGFLIARLFEDFDGQWTAYVMMGWTDTTNGKEQFKSIVDDYLKKGVHRIQFITRRNPKVFARWAGLDWKVVATTFELRR